jgi:uncharacterized protein (DUF433 family)
MLSKKYVMAPAYVAKLLGHSTLETFYRHYARLIEDSAQQQEKILSSQFVEQVAEKVAVLNSPHIITIEPGRRGGKPCIRGMHITVSDVLEYLAGGMSIDDIPSDFPDFDH